MKQAESAFWSSSLGEKNKLLFQVKGGPDGMFKRQQMKLQLNCFMFKEKND